jgi:3-deoxy-D-manno-octulosonic-acid transferase
VGGSFFDFGGHNPLEPAYYEKPIIMGKYHSSCLDSVQKLLAEEAILICEADQLEEHILKLYHDKSLRASLATNAKRVLTQNAGSLDYHLIEIERNLKQNHA